MLVGCPKEIKIKENRVGLIPSSVKMLIASGHGVLIEKGAGRGAGFSDEDYLEVGAQIARDAKAVWQRAELIVKVKEPLPAEFEFMQSGQLLFTFLHLAAEPELTAALIERRVNSVAYETIEHEGQLPLLRPMSEVAGKLSVQMGAWCLEKNQGGSGILLGGVPGVPPANVSIIGGGVVGTQAAKVALGMGAQVTLLDNNLKRLAYLDDMWGGRVQTLYSNEHNIFNAVSAADLVIGAVLLVGAKAPNLVTRKMLPSMRPGSVIVDVAIDQGGCVESIRRTDHDNPTFVEGGVVHYGVANMPGAVPRTSTFALSNATTPYLMRLANLGLSKACLNDPGLLKGINTYDGRLTYEPVAKSLNIPFTPASEFIRL